MKYEKNKKFSKIVVMGLGYIGLPTATLFASKNIAVHGVDIDSKKIDAVNNGELLIHEPGLGEIYRNVIDQKLFSASSTSTFADAFIIAVPTPLNPDNKSANLTHVRAAIETIAQYLQINNLLVIESTCPLGTTELVAEWLQELRPDLCLSKEEPTGPDVAIAYCPERVIPGNILGELISNERIIGGRTKNCSKLAVELYQEITTGACNTVKSPKTAELIKLTENSYRDVNIAFANEISLICDKEDIDVTEVINLANRHPRVDILRPGAGVGGHCIAIDPWFLIERVPQYTNLIKAARAVNSFKPKWIIEKINNLLVKIEGNYQNINKKQILIRCFGLSYKENTSDLRESPAVEIVSGLMRNPTVNIEIVEPNIETLPDSLSSAVLLTEPEQYTTPCDLAVFLVAHAQFRNDSRLTAIADSHLDIAGVFDN